MRDLECFRLLLARSYESDALEPLLVALAKRSPRQRVPYFGPLLDLLRDDSAAAQRLHGAALACVSDADGHVMVEAIVESLSRDGSREHAIAALRRVALRQPNRWVHALFHPDAPVRALALAEAAPEPARSLEIFLLADEASREAVRRHGLVCEAEGIGAVLELLAKGVVDPATARTLLHARAANDLHDWITKSRRRSEPLLARLYGAFPREPAESELYSEGDDLDTLLDLFWEDDAHGSGPFFAMLARQSDLTLRTIFSLLAVARRRGRFSTAALVLLLALEPTMLGWTFLPEATRREAAARSLELATPLRKFAPVYVQPALFCDLCLHPGGGPDLRVVAALMTLTNTGEPMKQAMQWIGERTFGDAIASRPAESAAIFYVLDKDDMFKAEIYAGLEPKAREAVVNAFVREAPTHLLPFLLRVEGARLGEALAPLVNDEIDGDRARKLAEVATQRLDAVLLNDLLYRWKPRGLPEEDARKVQLGHALLFEAARSLDVPRFVDAVTRSTRTLGVILAIIDASTTFPYGKEMALAQALLGHPDPDARRWAHTRVRPPEPPPPVAHEPPPDALAQAIATCKRVELDALVVPFRRGGRAGLAAAIARRTDNPAPDAAICVALLASCDDVELTDAQLTRYGAPGEELLREIEIELCALFAHSSAPISPLGHAVLWRFERHGKAFLEKALERWGDLASVTRGLVGLRWPLARRVGFQALADAIAVMGARDKPRFARLVGPAVVEGLLVALASDAAHWVADGLLSVWRNAPALMAPIEERVRAMLVDLGDATREKLSVWIDSVGLPSRPVAPPPPPEPDDLTIARLRASVDVDDLVRACADARPTVVYEATMRLVTLGEQGRAALAGLLDAAEAAPAIAPIAESVTLWDAGPALDRARALIKRLDRPADVRFAVGLALLERGERDVEPDLVACTLVPSTRPWFRPEHWTKLVALGIGVDSLALALAPCPQPHAYLAAVQHLLAHGEGDAAAAALGAFLEAGTERMGSLRHQVAVHLHALGDFGGYPIVLEHELESTKGASTLLAGASPAIVRATALSFLAAGNGLAKEATLLHHLAPSAVDPIAKDEAYETILLHCASDPIRQRAAQAVRSGLRKLHKLMRVAETFAWGARMGQELLGRLYRVHMTGGQSLGHTRLEERRIFVTPLPILRGDRHGREIVEALILHELGHHIYHRGKDGMSVWNEAQREGIHGLLNLVADEHLERNLRAMDPEFGDRLKRLAAYAFQHTEREVPVRTLLGHLGARAFDVLTRARLGVARDPDKVTVQSGDLLFAMEREELPFARFVRALRMGLGNRHDDPLVAQALAMFEGGFRQKSMRELLDLSRKLRDLFGWQVQMVETIGPHETLEQSGASEEIIWGEGITQDEIDRLVERVLDPKSREGAPPTGPPGRPMINVSPKNDFDRITHIERVPFDATAHRDYARRVARPAAVMRRYLEELGLHHVQQHGRLRGSRFDKSRVLPLILRNEPRVLLQRELETRTDLFLGIVIDCSGSMATRDNMERARQFGTLLSEACAGLSGVDLRIFGFTDKIIYDCGDAARCSAYALRSSGGNNDAAALFHAANVARASRRKAKLLVMISDGLPTECSVAALRELVTTLTKRFHMVCAQVAVQPLAEVCFPHYVVCNDETIEQTVTKFGRIVMRLVQRTLRG